MLLDKEKIHQQISNALSSHSVLEVDKVLASIEVLSSVDSTNSYLQNQQIITSMGKLCVAEEQSLGRGRHGNEWHAQANKNIILSLSWGFESRSATISALGLAVGLIVVERLNQDYSLGVGIKWPNDLFLNSQKLAGILVDATLSGKDNFNVVIGLGLNVQQENLAPTDSSYDWTDLYSHGVIVNRNELIGNLTADLLTMLYDFAERGFEPLVERWNTLSLYNRKQIKLTPQLDNSSSSEVIQGQMLGVNRSGQLLLLRPDGEQQVITTSNYSLSLCASDE